MFVDLKQRHLLAHAVRVAIVGVEGGVKGKVFTVESLRELHRRFSELLPDELLVVSDPATGKKVRVIAGELRQDDVQVGRHLAISRVAFIFASFGDPRGLKTIADILSDRSERPEGQGIVTAPGDGRYRFERQVSADRYYAAHLLGDLRDPRGIALLVPLLNDAET